MKMYRTVILLLFLGWSSIAGCSKTPCPPGESILLKSGKISPFKKQLFAITTDGSGIIECEIPKINGDRPVWSPDRDWIAYDTAQTEHPNKSQIYVIHNESNKPTQITNHVRGARDATWSPDRNIIAYSAGSIYLADVNCLYQEKKCDGSPIKLTTGLNPEWSPDGKRIAFERYSTQDGRFIDVWIMNVDDVNNMKEISIQNTNGCYDPAWSPDGTMLALSCSVNNRKDIYVIDINTNISKNITKSPSDIDVYPSWSPDGEKIAFISTGGEGLGECLHPECTVSSNAVYIIDVDGTNRVRLTYSENEHVYWYVWIPE